GTHTYAARARDKEGTPNASAYSPTKSGTPSSGTATMRFNPGLYGDCNSYGASPFLALNNTHYNTVKACIDYYPAVGGMTGVFVKASWTSFEGNTLGCYDASCSNDLGSAGTIG